MKIKQYVNPRPFIVLVEILHKLELYFKYYIVMDNSGDSLDSLESMKRHKMKSWAENNTRPFVVCFTTLYGILDKD